MDGDFGVEKELLLQLPSISGVSFFNQTPLGRPHSKKMISEVIVLLTETSL